MNDERKPERNWAPWAVLGGLVGMQTLLLLATFNPSPHSGGDNAGYLSLAYSLVDRGAYLELYEPGEPLHTKYPPGYPAVLAAAMVLGARTWSAFKALSGVFMIGAVAATFLWSWSRRSWVFGAAVAVLLLQSEAFVYSAQWILSDPLFLFLTWTALYAFERAQAQGSTEGAPVSPRETLQPGSGREATWLAAGSILTVLAYFTRSAGLPLVVAAVAWMLLRKKYRWGLALGVGFGLPALLWWLRGRVGGAASYVSEFWMVSPYQPDLGTVGIGGLIGRVWANLGLYLVDVIPGGLIGVRIRWIGVLGVLLGMLATVGWARRARVGATVAELFAPMYLGLILLWPEVWSGDRFALPLYALVVFYAGEVILAGVQRIGPRLTLPVGATLVVLLLWPSSIAWRASMERSATCTPLVATQGPFACYVDRMREFGGTAELASRVLPEDAVVMTRKPRIFYVMSGIKSRVYPLSDDPDTLAAEGERTGASFVVIDYLDSLGGLYLIPAVQSRPGQFCTIASFGGDDRGVATELLGILPRAEWDTRALEPNGDGSVSVTIRGCGGGMIADPAREGYDPRSPVVPLLRGLDS